MQRFADEVRQRASTLRLSQAEVARRSGVTERAFHHYLTGRSEPSLLTLVRVAGVLGCTPNDLLGVGVEQQPLDEAELIIEKIRVICSNLDAETLRLALDLLRCVNGWDRRQEKN